MGIRVIYECDGQGCGAVAATSRLDKLNDVDLQRKYWLISPEGGVYCPKCKGLYGEIKNKKVKMSMESLRH